MGIINNNNIVQKAVFFIQRENWRVCVFVCVEEGQEGRTNRQTDIRMDNKTDISSKHTQNEREELKK